MAPWNSSRRHLFLSSSYFCSIGHHEIAAGKKQLKSLNLSDESGDAPTEPLRREKRPNIENYYVDDEG